METVWEEEAGYAGPRNLRDKIRHLEEQIDKAEKERITAQKEKKFRFPWKWSWRLRQSNKASKQEMALVLFFNKKNEIEFPKFVPIFSGNMIVYRHKAYEFDPRAIWRMRGIRGNPSVYCIREIDRRPIKNHDGTIKTYRGMPVYRSDTAISNMDIEEVRMRGDSTESDEFLIKAALKAQTKAEAIKSGWIIGIIVILAIVGVLVWLFTSGG